MAVAIIRPHGTGAYNTWALGAGFSLTAAVDPGSPVVHDGDTSRAELEHAVHGTGIFAQSFVMGARPAMNAVTSVEYGIAWTTSDNGDNTQAIKVFSRLNGTDSSKSSITGADTTYIVSTGTLNRPGGGSWTTTDLANTQLLELGFSLDAWNGPVDPGFMKVTSIWIILTYDPIPAQISQSRYTASQRLNRYYRATPVLDEIPCPLELLDAEPGDLIGVQDFGDPVHLDLGLGSKPWQIPAYRFMQRTVDPMSHSVAISLRGVRHELHTFWDVGRSLKTSGPTHDGIARSDLGNTRLWSRASNAWIEDPGDGFFKQLQDGWEKQGPDGQEFERAATNTIRRSSFVSAGTGWTVTDGLGIGAVTFDAPPTSDEQFFEPGVTENVMRMETIGQAADLIAEIATTTSYGANTHISVSVHYRETAGGTALKVRIQRLVDNRYWDGNSWEVAVTNLAVTASTVKNREEWEDIDVGGSSTQIKFYAVLVNGGGDGRIAYVGHVQVEATRWATSPIVTDGADGTRAIDSLAISHTAGVPAIFVSRWTLFCEYIRRWGTPASGTIFWLVDLTFDASNWIRLKYDFDAGQFKAEVRAAGTTYTATATNTPTRDSAVALAVRFTSSEGEHNLGAFVLSLFVAGTKGTDATAAAAPTQGTSSMYLGGDTGATASADGVVRAIRITQQALTDAECQRGGA